MSKKVRISLAKKCQLLFGAAVLLILTAALAVVWFRMQGLVVESQRERARELTNAWLGEMIEFADPPKVQEDLEHELKFTVVAKNEFPFAPDFDPFLGDAIAHFQTFPDQTEYARSALDDDGQTYYRYARAIRRSDLSRIRDRDRGYTPAIEVPGIVDPLEKVLVLESRSKLAQRQLLVNGAYLAAAGLFAGLLAIGVFWFIITHIILSPVRVLRDTAGKVSEGDLNIRSDINTGDEFEHLSDTFNTMLESLKSNEDQLRSINKSLDLKLGELAEHNVALYEANQIKDDFLANVSHELRTPLNSIIGFAEVLQETLQNRTGTVAEKRKRYASNIILSSKQLLELINDLLDLAKIEAGRIDLRVGPLSPLDTIEGLVNLIRPQTDKKQIQLQVDCPRNLPMLETDASKFQQILFNFLSNAVKFTPAKGCVTIAAKLIGPAMPDGEQRLKVSVSDTGPGIAPAEQERVFEKFTQLDSTVTREHAGTGLGLTISRELATLLQSRVELESTLGDGATFSLIMPLQLKARSAPLMPDLPDEPAT
jgi:two-component system sensor histidine kinase BarA